jgi:hypothetical protein
MEIIMMGLVESVEKFMVACDQSVGVDNETQSKLYWNLIKEELLELQRPDSDENELKELCDLIWVAIGYGLSRGWNVNGAFMEVARSNMSKVGADGKVIKNSDGKVIKPPQYSPADVKPFLS